MASKSGQDCETKVITIREQSDAGKVILRSAINLVSLKLQATLACSGLEQEQIKGVAEWYGQFCVATDRFLVFFNGINDDSNPYKHSGDMALPPEIGYVVAIVAFSESGYLYILSNWGVWTLSWGRGELTRLIEAPNMSSISVSRDGKMLLAGNTTLAMYGKYKTMIKQFNLPHEYQDMTICQAELTGAGTIVVSICGRGKNRLLLMNEDGIVTRVYDSPIRHANMESVDDTPGSMHCTYPNQLIASYDGNLLFVAETYPFGSDSSCHLCHEKIFTLDKDLQLNQIILPGPMPPHFKNYSRISCSRNRLMVVCMKVSHKDDANFTGGNGILTPVVNVYKL